ncbi:hypothetical protein RJT34_18376 [Clitoria ternatea]|uniref:Uncharacterized protein n=1 Tax=Clitoria ternatea TaxID=43366 RepID=A0AAN9JAP0_CLITE
MVPFEGCVTCGNPCTSALSFSAARLIQFRHLPFPSCRLNNFTKFYSIQSKPSQSYETSNFDLALYLGSRDKQKLCSKQ